MKLWLLLYIISEHGIIDPDDELNPNDNDETSDEETDVSGVLSVGLDQSDDERKDEDEWSFIS